MPALPIRFAAAACAALLAACARSVDVPAQAEPQTLSPVAVAEVEALIERDGDAAADALVALVAASPVDLPGGELDRLGRRLIERSDGERLLARLSEACVARAEDRDLALWLARLRDYERSILRGVDVYDDE